MRERHDTLTALRGHEMQKLDLQYASFPQSQIGGQRSYASRQTFEEGASSLVEQRQMLEIKYGHLFQEKPDYRQLVTYVPNKKLPVYNWFKFKEGFSRQLVFKLLLDWKISKDEIILDPFAGCGTTLLACKEFGCRAVGLDILPVAIFVAKVKLQDWPDLALLHNAIEALFDKKYKQPTLSFPKVAIIDKAFPKKVQDEILFYKECISEFEKPLQDFLMLGLISILEQVSYTSKDGQFLRLVDRNIPSVKKTLREQLSEMLADLYRQQQVLFKGGKAKVEILQGDARETDLPKKYWGKIGAVITSPPYLNRYDYSRTYSLELCTLFVDEFSDLRNIRHSLLRSHIESREHAGKEISLPALDEILKNLKMKDLNNDRIPIMIKGYFEDMNLVIKQLLHYLRPGGLIALVVANARFEGELVPTDLILSELAEIHGFKTEGIWVTRYKGNSSQQMGRYGRIPVRESIVFWRKPD
jgi:site-specific DNA-methyltransferase (cytosine-N4-specific)